MTEPDYAELAARVLGSRTEPQRASKVDRDRGISVVAQAMAERTRRQRARRALVGGLGVAALLALAATAWVRFVAPAGAERAVCDAACEAELTGHAGKASFPPGSHWTAGNTGLSVGFGAVTRLDLEPSSELLYRHAEGARRFRLLRGALHARVEKLGPERRFIVETHDAEVEVRGTAFEVALAPAPSCGWSTRVTVHEGMVEVRAGGGAHSLRAGQSWPAACAETLPEAADERQPPPRAVTTPAPARAPNPARAAHELPSPSLVQEPHPAPEVAAPEPVAATNSEHTGNAAATAPRSSLVEQNDLYARAVSAGRSGQPRVALELHAELVRRFPQSALVESALIERVRVLHKLDPARASSEARAYLRRFPNGFARDEARTVAEP